MDNVAAVGVVIVVVVVDGDGFLVSTSRLCASFVSATVLARLRAGGG